MELNVVDPLPGDFESLRPVIELFDIGRGGNKMMLHHQQAVYGFLNAGSPKTVPAE